MGFLPEMIKSVLERGMNAEFTDHLGYERGDRPGSVRGLAKRPLNRLRFRAASF
jgi:transposase-like protein